METSTAPAIIQPRLAAVTAATRSEADLLSRHASGDPTAFAELVSRYRAPIYSYLCRAGVSPAERDDLFQEIFIKIHRAAASFNPVLPAHPWIFTIVANTVRNHLRAARVRSLTAGEIPASEPQDPAPDSERRAVARDAVRRLEDAIRRLPLVKREVVLLATVEKLPLKEVARILGIGVNTVKTHLRRARQTLTRELAAFSDSEVSP